jgi:hypothetical protein
MMLVVLKAATVMLAMKMTTMTAAISTKTAMVNIVAAITAIAAPAPPHHAKPTPVGIQAVSLVFVTVFLAVVIVGGFIACGLLTNFLINIVRLFKPNFCQLKRPQDETLAQPTNKQVQKVALDYLLEQTRKERESEMPRRRKRFVSPLPSHIQRRDENEWDLESLTAATTLNVVKPESRKDLWAIARYSANSKPQYLCFKAPTKSGLRCAFAAVRSHRLTMSLESAQRWLGMLEPDAVIVPANAYARQMRHQLRMEFGRMEGGSHDLEPQRRTQRQD